MKSFQKLYINLTWERLRATILLWYNGREVKNMVTVDIDELTPCLIDSTTGEIVETEVIRIKRHSFLSKYNKITGWYTYEWTDESI